MEQFIGITKQMTSELGDFTRILTVLGDGDRNLLVVGLFILFFVFEIYKNFLLAPSAVYVDLTVAAAAQPKKKLAAAGTKSFADEIEITVRQL